MPKASDRPPAFSARQCAKRTDGECQEGASATTCCPGQGGGSSFGEGETKSSSAGHGGPTGFDLRGVDSRSCLAFIFYGTLVLAGAPNPIA